MVTWFLLPPKHQAPSSLRGSRLSSKIAGIFASFSIQSIHLRSKISPSDSIPRLFLISSSLILRIRRSRLVILDIAQTQLLKRTLRLWRWPADSVHESSQPNNERFMTINFYHWKWTGLCNFVFLDRIIFWRFHRARFFTFDLYQKLCIFLFIRQLRNVRPSYTCVVWKL